MRNPPELGQDIIDSRDVIERLEELENAATDEANDLGCTACGEGSGPDGEIPALCDECADELRMWRDFTDQGSSASADWEYGEAFILESYFTTYAQQLADDIGAVDAKADWPNAYIDWEAAAEALQGDYSSIEVDGYTYYAR